MPNSVRQTTSNTFSKGLVMDFDPTVTQNDRMVNALNATLLTFNGNEMNLQQDMGNGRVETAFLPEGYVPVGSCEFGDIIYIVSYNPLENKSQIGCFPSPERNISSDETVNLQQSVAASDFQKFSNNAPTGVLIATSAKKIVYGDQNMNPGDKYIIYTTTKGFGGSNPERLSDFANTSHTHNTWPKLLKLSVVAIEDSGKIVDLNASVKWYDNDYYINTEEEEGGTPDLDSYRSLVSSAYAVFQSKVSGKLAILAELETIDGFACTYDVYIKEAPETKSDDDSVITSNSSYDIYFYTSWETSHNDINPTGYLFTKSEWTNVEDGGKPNMPVYDDGTNIVTYTYGEVHPLPINIDDWVVRDENGKVISYDYGSIIYTYTRLYELDNPSADFSTYIDKESYNARIDAIIDWYSVNTQHEAVALPDEDSADKLRLVTKVTRLLDSEGEPDSGSGGKWMYVYNLDSVGKTEKGDTVYNTKLADGSLAELNPIGLTDDVVNNWFGKDIPSLLPTDDFTLPRSITYTIGIGEDQHKETFDVDLSRMVWNYEVAPVMPYGVLDYLAVQGTIDFSKLGSGLIDLTAWRYYNSGDVSTLTWGLDAYTEPNKGIAEVVFDFYDNQGYAASYHNANKTSYAGTFTESIVLGQQNSSYKLNSTDAYGNNDHCHAGMADDSGTVWLNTKNKPQLTEEDSVSGPYLNDVGTLYPNWLYLVRITVKYCNKNILDEYDTDNTTNFKTFYRWYWTNGMFNENYYSVVDFDVLIPQLPLDCSATFDTRKTNTTNALVPKYVEYTNVENLSSFTDVSNDLARTLGAYVYAVNQDEADDDKGNIQMTVEPYISEAYNTFNMDEKELDQLSVTCSLGKSSITRTVEQPSLIYSGDEITTGKEDIVQPITAEYLCSHNDNNDEPYKYFDRSGYLSYGYGANGCNAGPDILSLLGTTDKHGEYSSSVDYTPSGEAYPASNDIYTGSTEYKYYPDSFSLNLAGSSGYEFANVDEGQDPLEYYDSTGTLVDDVTHYQYKTLTATEARSTGFPLVLAGTTYSKLYTAQCREDSDVKVLRSVIYNAQGYNDSKDLSTTNSPEMLGLHLFWNSSTGSQDRHNCHMYFNQVFSFTESKARGARPHFRASGNTGLTGETWSGGTEWQSSEYKSGESGSDTSKSILDEEKFQDWLHDFSNYPLMAFVIARNSLNSGTVQYTYSKNGNFNTLKKAFDYTSSDSDKKYIHNSTDDIPRNGAANWGGKHVIHTCAIVDSVNGLIVPMADWFHSYDSAASQKSNVYPSNDIPGYSLGDMIGSLFAQLYVVDSNTKESGVILDDVVSVQDYTEYWNKDIVLDLEYVGSTDSSKDIKDLLCIQTQSMRNYINFMIDNGDLPALDSGEYNTYNIDITLYPIQRSIAFQYGVPYALGNMQYLYSNLSLHKNYIYLSESDDGVSLNMASFTEDVSDNTLYTWDGVGSVAKLGTGSALYYADTFGITSVDSYLYIKKRSDNMTIDSVNFSGLSSFINYTNDGYITFGDYTSMPNSSSTYDVSYKATSDSIIIGDFPRISFFNKFKPS